MALFGSFLVRFRQIFGQNVVVCREIIEFKQKSAKNPETVAKKANFRALDIYNSGWLDNIFLFIQPSLIQPSKGFYNKYLVLDRMESFFLIFDQCCQI